MAEYNEYGVREYFEGLSVLRLLSMFYIIILHILLQGGILKAGSGLSHGAAWFLEIGAFCAVNIYAILSGFLSYSESDEPYPYYRFVTLWFQVTFYNVILTLLLYLTNRDVLGGREVLKAFFPITFNTYWYFSAYAGVVLVAPLIHYLVRTLSETSQKMCALAAVLVFSVFGAISSHAGDPLGLRYGYSFLWLAVLYFLGAVMRSCRLYGSLQRGLAVLGILISWVLLFAAQIALETHFTDRADSFAHDGFYFSYLSPAVLLMAIFYVLLFVNVRLPDSLQLLADSFAPCAFGVYLLHAHPLTLRFLIADHFAGMANLPFPVLILAVLLIAALIFILTILADYLRRILFERLRAERMSRRIEYYVRDLIRMPFR
ncbi:MAG: acyltransferase [Lachnospiraceae bacterium]|nr:acyltransferase [Lachnospiraceae bacterium]